MSLFLVIMSNESSGRYFLSNEILNSCDRLVHLILLVLSSLPSLSTLSMICSHIYVQMFPQIQVKRNLDHSEEFVVQGTRHNHLFLLLEIVDETHGCVSLHQERG